MSNFLKTIGIICAGWVTLSFFFLTVGLFKEGKIGEGILSILILELIPAIITFYAFKFSKRYSDAEKRKIQEQNELRIKQKEEKERLYAEQKEKELEELKIKYPEHWENILSQKLTIGMTLEMISIFLGEPQNRKETVTKSKITEKYNFHPYINAQKKISYRMEVTLENGLVTGWKEL